MNQLNGQINYDIDDIASSIEKNKKAMVRTAEK